MPSFTYRAGAKSRRQKKTKKTRIAYVSKPVRTYVSRTLLGEKPYYFTRRAGLVANGVGVTAPTISSITVVGGTISYGTLFACLATMSNVTDFSNLFDQYKIMGYSITFSTRYSGSSAGTGGIPSPTMYTVIDTNDPGTPTSINQLREYKVCKVHYFNNEDKRKKTIYWQPRINLSGDGLSGLIAQPNSKPWINFNATSVQMSHYGLKYALILDAPATDSVIIDLEAKFYMKFRNVQ